MAIYDSSYRGCRIDDIGAASKYYNRYANKRIYNLPFLWDRRFFGRWAPYPELEVEFYERLIDQLIEAGSSVTLAITACWVEPSGALIPFDEKYPDQAIVISSGIKAGVFEVANHGLTHCVLANNAFKPSVFKSVRRFHREFWDYLPESVINYHISRSQEILASSFGGRPEVLIPPGNVYGTKMLACAFSHGIRWVSCRENLSVIDEYGIFRSDAGQNIFHDREFVLKPDSLDGLDLTRLRKLSYIFNDNE